MQFTFLGTSAGTPTRSRNVSGLALQHGGNRGWYLIDCGEATQHQVLRTPYSLQQLRAIFITHVHGDHTYGLPGLLASASMAGRTTPLHIVAPASIREFVEVALKATDSNLGFRLDFTQTGSPDFSWSDDWFDVSSVALSHRVPCHAYVFTENNLERKLLIDKLRSEQITAGPLWGELQRGKNVLLDDGRYLKSDDYVSVSRSPRRIIVAGDNDNPYLLDNACRGAQVLIHEATYTQAVADRVGSAPQHSSAERVARFAATTGIPNLILTHFSSRYQFRQGSTPHIDEIEDEARKFYRGNLYLARDFVSFSLNKDLTLTQH